MLAKEIGKIKPSGKIDLLTLISEAVGRYFNPGKGSVLDYG